MSDKKIKAVKEDNKKKPGFFSKLILLWVLPCIYAIGLGMIILHFAGVSLTTQMKWVQDHTKVFYAKKQTSPKTASTKTAQSSSSQTKTADTAQNTSSNQTTAETNSNSGQNNTAQTSNTSAGSNTPSAAPSLASMDPSTAAKLLSNMSEADALKNLKQLQPDAQSSIIAQMPADEGAKLTDALSNGGNLATTTNSVSELYQHMTPDQIATVLNGISDKQQVLNQIKQLDPDTASKVISQLNPTVAGWVVTHLN
ncbi:hypothetical protein HPT25_18525 [Bacillus sp. BRMEA1]|uniref:magnesium transporter MgtE N-terminal domain-containing protein n=1 Tax=Neobacillus endophyticus TaxID=2738405 RepID=UPI00156534FB|nr:hypothetical protein [Neobacillus endophyticus]NRD79360.1 hypothetical protein [Neobacillus endophyticus]